MIDEFPHTDYPHVSFTRRDEIIVTVWKAPISPDEFMVTVETAADGHAVTALPAGCDRRYLWVEADLMGIASLSIELAEIIDPLSPTASETICQALSVFYHHFYED